MSRYSAETIGCHEWNERLARAGPSNSQARLDKLTQTKCGAKVRCGAGEEQSSAAQPQQLAAERGVMLGERACLRGRWSRTRAVEAYPDWEPNPAAARMRGTSCYINLGLLQGIALLYCAGSFPIPYDRYKPSAAAVSHDALPSSRRRLLRSPRPLMSLLESLSTAPCTPSLTDLSIALSLAPGSATPPSLVAGLRTANRSAFKKRQRRNLGAGPKPTLVSHASQCPGMCWRTCFEHRHGRASAECSRL